MFRKLSLAAKVTVLLSMVVFGVVLAITYFLAESSKSVIEDDYRKRSINAAERLASKLGEHPQLPPKDDMEDLLFGASEKNLSITEISIFRSRTTRSPTLRLRTSMAHLPWSQCCLL